MQLTNINTGEVLSATSKMIIQPVIGFDPYDIWTTLSKLQPYKLPENYWLDWQLKDWLSTYHKMFHQSLCLTIDQTKYILPQIIEYDNTSENRRLSEFNVVKNEEDFKLPANISDLNNEIIPFYQGLKRTIIGGTVHFYNGNCARLKDFDKEKLTFIFQKSKYFDYLKTNLSMDCENPISLRHNFHTRFGQLMPLKESVFGNHLGINILLITREGKIVVQKRSATVLTCPKELCPSASGKVSYTDVELLTKGASYTLADLNLKRELSEELGHDVTENSKELVFLGLTRELIRGGKPESFFLCHTKMASKEVMEAYKNSKSRNVESTQIHFYNTFPFNEEKVHHWESKYNSGSFRNIFKNVLQEISKNGKVSIMLITNLTFWYKYKLEGH